MKLEKKWELVIYCSSHRLTSDLIRHSVAVWMRSYLSIYIGFHCGKSALLVETAVILSGLFYFCLIVNLLSILVLAVHLILLQFSLLVCWCCAHHMYNKCEREATVLIHAKALCEEMPQFSNPRI